MTRAEALNKGRKSLQKKAWSEAFSILSAEDEKAPLDPEDLEELSTAAHLIGKEAEVASLLARAHQGFLSRGETQRAIWCAVWLGFVLTVNGEPSQAGGWLSRAGRLLEGRPDCVEKGYMLLPDGIRQVHGGDPVVAHAAFLQAAAIGQRFGDRDLLTLALQGQGRALIRQGEIMRGLTLLDEAMVAVTAGEVSQRIAGGVYCSVIEACNEVFDLRRAQEWTSALDRWCSSQPDELPYRGACLVRRAEILQLHGAWPTALDAAHRACELLSQPAPKRGVGAAFYRIAELERLRGDFDAAEEAYRQASRWNLAPQPGLALLRMAQGNLDAARKAILSMAEAAHETCARVGILDAYVEIMLASNDVKAARTGANELSKIAEKLNAPLVRAFSDRACGAVLLAEDDPGSALAALRRSCNAWHELEAPYEAARDQVLMALAYRAHGDSVTADQALKTARDAFMRLGAAADLARVESLLNVASPRAAGPLTRREIEVLKIVAAGMSNKAIAAKLGISEKTVARHVSNIFTKLDLSSRAQATAYAYQNDLL